MREFQSVIVGGDLGAYALARELNDLTGVVPTLVTSYDTLPIRDSAIVQRHELAHADDEETLVAGLIELGRDMTRRRPGVPIVLLANTDWRIDVLTRHRSELDDLYVMALPPRATVEHVSDKLGFEQVATAAGLSVPRSWVADFSGADEDAWQLPTVAKDIAFPVVAKPVTSSAYETVVFEGRKKVYFLHNADEVTELWAALAAAGFRDRFMLQELVEGDDTSMYSVTAYVDRSGRMTMGVAARVLLEEHAPATLGNPCAMVTIDSPALLDSAERFLASVDYHGFANFDIKEDARTGRRYFLEVNPRIGRNSFYCVGAGVNPMEVMLADVLGDERREPIRARRAALYSLVPQLLLEHYLTDGELRRRVRSLARSGRVVDPLDNPVDRHVRRRWYRLLGRVSHVRKFARYYPRPTHTGF